MKCSFIHLKIKDKSFINLNNNTILELFKLSVGNNIYNLIHNKNKKESSKKNLEIIYYKKYIKENIGKMIYKNCGNEKKIAIINKIFISKNKERAKIIINNKQYELKENLEKQKHFFQKIKIKFFDHIIFSNCMFKDCESLSLVKNFENINTKYLKEIYSLFEGWDVVHYYIYMIYLIGI